VKERGIDDGSPGLGSEPDAGNQGSQFFIADQHPRRGAVIAEQDTGVAQVGIVKGGIPFPRQAETLTVLGRKPVGPIEKLAQLRAH